MLDELLLVGLNHKVAPVALREQLAFRPERIPSVLQALAASIESPNSEGHPCQVEAALLSTCNRSEIYVHCPDTRQAEGCIREFLTDLISSRPQGEPKPAQALQQALYVSRGGEAAHHLMSVAAGLDSLVIGENEILGQVKGAYAIAQQAKTTGAILSALFRSAVRAGKRVRSETEIGKTALSVASMVVELAQETFGCLENRTALLIGAGKISSMTGCALVKAGLRCVLVANRTYERALRLANRLGREYASAVHFDALQERLVEADIVICSTGAPHLVLKSEAVRQAMDRRPERLLLVADLAVPRDAEAAIGDIPGVKLTDIDDLERLVKARRPMTASVYQAAQKIVEEELENFRVWCRNRRSVPLIRALRSKAEAIRQEQVELTLNRLEPLSPEQQGAIDAMSQAIINKLLHDPIISLKNPPCEDLTPDEYAGLIEAIFGIR
jgi:glutamyl-tRNA reductase